MSIQQIFAVKIYRICGVVASTAIILWVVFFYSESFYRSLFVSTYKSVGAAQIIGFSSVPADM
jgi:hypothetical protein